MSKIIGLTGNIGSGKSLAAGLLKEMGAAVIDADALSRQVMEPGLPAHAEIRASFGSNYLLPNGEVDRKKLGKLIFNDKEARARLNGITHPRIREQAVRRVETYIKQGYAMIVLEAALLLESNDYGSLLDEIWLVTAPPEQIYDRLSARDALTVAEAKARLSAQMPVEKQAELADRVIANDGDIESLRAKMDALYRDITKG